MWGTHWGTEQYGDELAQCTDKWGGALELDQNVWGTTFETELKNGGQSFNTSRQNRITRLLRRQLYPLTSISVETFLLSCYKIPFFLHFSQNVEGGTKTQCLPTPHTSHSGSGHLIPLTTSGSYYAPAMPYAHINHIL